MILLPFYEGDLLLHLEVNRKGGLLKLALDVERSKGSLELEKIPAEQSGIKLDLGENKIEFNLVSKR